MPEHDPHDQTDPAGEPFDPTDDESAVPTDQGADSADNAAAPPEADAPHDEAGYVDQSFSKINKLTDALSKLSQAGADDKFNAKIKQITQQASDAQNESASEPALSEPTEQIEQPAESPVQPLHQPRVDGVPPAAPDVPVETIEPSEPVEASETSDEQIAAPPQIDDEIPEPPFDPDAVVQPLEAFARSELDDLAERTAGESSDDDEPQQPETEDTGLTSEDLADDVTAAPPESQSFDPISVEQESAPLEEHSNADESDSADSGDVQAETLGSVSESSVENEVVDAPLESVDEIQSESSDEQPDSYESPNEESDTLGDSDATLIDTDQPDQSVASEQDSKSEALLETAGEPPDHEPLTDSTSDSANVDPPSASFTAEELAPQIGEIISSFKEPPQTTPPRPLPQAIARNLADESASLDSQPEIDLSWLANELNDLLNPEADEPASGQQSESAESGDPVPEGTASPGVDAPQSPDQESVATDGSNSIDDAPHDVVTMSGDVGVDFDEIAAEQAESVSEVDAPQDTQSQAEPSPAEPIDAESSIVDESIASTPIDTVDSAEDDPIPSEISPPVQDGEPSAPTQETPADETPEQPDADLMKSVAEALAEAEAEATVSSAEVSTEDRTTDSVPTEPPVAATAIEPGESENSADDAFSTLSAQLDELLGGTVESTSDQTPSDPVAGSPPAIDSAAPPERAETTGDSLDDAPGIDAQVSAESTAIDEPDDFMASPMDEANTGIDETPVAEAEQTTDEGVASTESPPESAAVDEPGDFMSSPADENDSVVDESPAADVEQPESDSVDSTNAATESASVDEAEDFMASPADEDDSIIDEALATAEAQQPAEGDESTEPTADSSQDDAPDDPEAQSFMSETESDDAESTESLDQTFAETDAPEEDPDAESKAFWPGAGADDESDSDEAAAQPEAEGQDTADADSESKGTEDLKDAAVATVRLVRFHAALERIEPVAVPILRRANYPLRHVPQALRPIVDWVALSLLFWVPIVWVIALLAR